MRELILLRHAKAVSADSVSDDRTRGLTDRGRREAKAAGAALKAAGIAWDAARVSSSARTRETAALALGDSPAPAPVYLDTLYLAEPETIWAVAQSTGADRVLVIGHNPGLHELAMDLIRQAHDRSKAGLTVQEGLPTSAFAHFALKGDVLDAAAPVLLNAWRAPK